MDSIELFGFMNISFNGFSCKKMKYVKFIGGNVSVWVY